MVPNEVQTHDLRNIVSFHNHKTRASAQSDLLLQCKAPFYLFPLCAFARMRTHERTYLRMLTGKCQVIAFLN